MAHELPAHIIYGKEMPDVRFHGQRYFCRRNRNIHLRDEHLPSGTYEAGQLLAEFCQEFCAPNRDLQAQPCPGLIESHSVHKEYRTLATVKGRTFLKRCAGVQRLLDMTQTREERQFLAMYLQLRAGDEHNWRDELIADWNDHWQSIEDDFLLDPTEKLDRALWRTLRFPALIPQAWLNWLNATPVDSVLDEEPSRVDFMAFYGGQRHIIEIDGPSHYASYDEATKTHTIDERMYARNLKIARSLQRNGWILTRIGRSEVRDAMQSNDLKDFGGMVTKFKLVSIVPFPKRNAYPLRPTYEELGLPELDVIHVRDVDEIPF
jgi:very-short-patch-repair endonuclease